MAARSGSGSERQSLGAVNSFSGKKGAGNFKQRTFTPFCEMFVFVLLLLVVLLFFFFFFFFFLGGGGAVVYDPQNKRRSQNN